MTKTARQKRLARLARGRGRGNRGFRSTRMRRNFNRVNNNFVGPLMPSQRRNRPRRRVNIGGRSGRGGWLRNIARLGGNAIGNYLGLGNAGDTIDAGISHVFGRGDYIVNSPSVNSLMSSVPLAMSGGPPAMSPLTSGFRLSHREYLRDVMSSQEFSTFTLALNPGISATFPWLAQVAANFEEYKIHGMIFYLNTLSGVAVASTNAAQGYWGCVTQYDASDPAFDNKASCENYVGAQAAVPWKSIVHGIECKPRVNVLDNHYVRTDALDSGEDIKFYDWGKFQFFTGGSQSTEPYNLGELWVSYDIEFTKPRLPNEPLVNAGFHYRATSGISSAAIFGTNGTFVASTNPEAFEVFTNNRFRLLGNHGLPTGYYLILHNILTSNATLTVPSPQSNDLSAAVIAQPFVGGTSVRLYAPAPNAQTNENSWLLMSALRYLDPTKTAEIEFTGTVMTGGTADNSELIVIYCGADVLLPDISSNKECMNKLTKKQVHDVKYLLEMLPQLKEIIYNVDFSDFDSQLSIKDCK